jgi:hypothetical protein
MDTVQPKRTAGGSRRGGKGAGIREGGGGGGVSGPGVGAEKSQEWPNLVSVLQG